jgi:hypothetical protein
MWKWKNRCLASFFLICSACACGGCSKKEKPKPQQSNATPSTARDDDSVARKSRNTGKARNANPTPNAQNARTGSHVGAAARLGTRPAPTRTGKAASPRTDRQAIYALYMQGGKVGRLTAAERYHGKQVTSRVEARLTLRRAGMTIKMRTLEVFTEKLDGTPVSFRVLVDQQLSKMEARGIYKNGKMIVTDSAGKRTIPYKKHWLFPWTAAQRAKAKGFSPSTTYTYTKFEPQLGMKGIQVTHKVLGDTQKKVMGKTVTCHRIQVSSPSLPTQNTCVDDDLMAYTMDFKLGPFLLEMKLVGVKKGRATPPKTARAPK